MQLRTVKMLVLKDNSVRLQIVLKRVKKIYLCTYACARVRVEPDVVGSLAHQNTGERLVEMDLGLFAGRNLDEFERIYERKILF